MSNKQRVLDFIKHDRTLQGAKEIYNSLPNKSLSFNASLNRMRPTEANIKQVAYQLCKAVGLEERQMLALWGAKVVPAEKEEKERGIVITLDSAGGSTDRRSSEVSSWKPRLISFNAEAAAWKDIQGMASDVSEATERSAEGRSKIDLLAFLQEERNLALQEESKTVPLEIKKSIKLREQFPFLREKDCPAVLKLLVNNMITAYENYKKGRAKLFDSLTEAEEADLARDIVDNFIENKQAFAELEHYKKSGEILGEHPIFEEQKIIEDLDSLSAEELNKKDGALRKNISTNKKKAAETEDAEEKAKYESAVEFYSWQAKYVKSLLKKK